MQTPLVKNEYACFTKDNITADILSNPNVALN